MSELVVAANRGPGSVSVAADGSLSVGHGAGGLAPSLARALEGSEATWVAAAMTADEHRAVHQGAIAEVSKGVSLRLVELPEEVQAAAYRVIANGTLWFCLHAMFDRVRRPLFDRHWHEAWESYRRYNRAFAEAICEHADDGATVVVNDYHLTLVGAHLARDRPDLRTIYFSHTPFCTPEELAVLPQAQAKELMSSLASFGACGFHTARWEQAFRACAKAIGIESPATCVTPLGADPEELLAIASTPTCRQRSEALRERVGSRKLLLRSDRIEPSKNLIRGFLAFEELLLERPKWRGEVVFLARVYPSRQELPEYLAYRSELEHVVERVNGRFATTGPPPIELEVADDFEGSVAALSCYDALLVNPIRDGMNLVAKEGPIVNRRDGVLALSHEAGAFAELGGSALSVDPFDVSGTAAVLDRALTMAAPERSQRAARLAELASVAPPARWLADIVSQARLALTPRS